MELIGQSELFRLYSQHKKDVPPAKESSKGGDND